MAPGVYLLVCYLVLLPVILFDAPGPLAAIVRSVQIMRQLWWPAFAALVIAVLLSFIGAIVFAAVLAVVADALAGNGAAMKAVVNCRRGGLLRAVLCLPERAAAGASLRRQ